MDQRQTPATWAEQLDRQTIEIRPIAAGRRNLPAGELMLYPNARAVDDAIRAIPPGESRTTKELRTELARQYGAEITCPVTARRSLRVVAEAAYEAFQTGTPLTDVTPIWRVLDANAALLKRLSFDPTFILAQRTREGISVSSVPASRGLTGKQTTLKDYLLSGPDLSDLHLSRDEHPMRSGT